VEGNDAAGDDLYLLGEFQAGPQDLRQVWTEERFPPFQADKVYPSKAGEGFHHGFPLAAVEFPHGFLLHAAVPAAEGTAGGQGNIQGKSFIR
jgi:hypothetical protein